MPYETSFARFRAATTNAAETAPELQPIQLLAVTPPTASAPLEGLPSDAVIGRFYVFASRPSTLYTIGPDNVWRAILPVSVT